MGIQINPYRLDRLIWWLICGRLDLKTSEVIKTTQAFKNPLTDKNSTIVIQLEMIGLTAMLITTVATSGSHIRGWRISELSGSIPHHQHQGLKHLVAYIDALLLGLQSIASGEVYGTHIK